MNRQDSALRQGALRFAEQWPYLRYLGMGAWWAWIWQCYSGVGLFAAWPQGPQTPYVGMMYLYSTPAIACALILAGVFWQKTTPLFKRRWFMLASGIVAFVGTLLVAHSPWMGGTAAFAAGAIMTGLGTAALCIKTGLVFGTLAMRESLTAGSVALMFAAFMFFMGAGLPIPWQPLFAAVMPLASALLYIMPGDDPYPTEIGLVEAKHGLPGHPSEGKYIRLVLASVLVAGTAGFSKGIAAMSMEADAYMANGSVITFLIFVAAVVICFVANCGDIVKACRFIYAALMLYGVAVLLTSCFGLDIVYMNVGKEALWMVFTCFMAYMVFRFDLSPVRAFGFGQAAYLVTSAASWAGGIAFAPLYYEGATRLIVAVAMAFLIVLIILFVFTERDLHFILTYREKDAATSEEQRQNGEESQVEEETDRRELTIEEKIKLLDPKYGISEREAEIMGMFAQGRSANWIADELVISKNTVRSHIRSIYTKLDVHNRQELIDAIENMGK